MSSTRIIFLSVLIAAVLVAGACQPVAQPSEPLVVAIDNDEGPITPANFNTFIGYWLVGWVYDSLFVRDPDLGVVPSLALESSTSPDGLTWEIKLRDDVEWHDGEPFTAEDVVFSYNFLVDAGRAQELTVIESIEAVDEHTLSIQLSAPTPFFLYEGLATYYIMPEHIWKDQQPVSGELSQFQGYIGTGPYKLQEIVPGESYTFEANSDYFDGEPQVDQAIVKIVKDRTQQINQIKTGDISAVLSSVPPALVADLEEDPEIELAQGSDFFNYVFYMNGSRPPFDNPEVRKAIAQAIDAETLVETVMLGQGTVLPLSYYHPDLPWAMDIPHTFDPDAARAALEVEGLVDSDNDGIREFDGAPLEYEIMCDVNNPVEVRSTELIIGWLEDVGIPAEARCMDIDTEVTFIWPNFVAIPDPDYDMAIWGWSSGPQSKQGFIQFMTNGDFGEGAGWANLTGTSDPELDELVNELVVTTDPDLQQQLSRQIQERFAEVLLFIPLMSPGGNFAYRPADYDGWVYMKGTGIMTPWSFLPTDSSN